MRQATRALRRRSRRGLILLYHRIAGPRFDPLLLDVSPEHFDAHLTLLARDWAPLPLDVFEDLRRAGALPDRAVAVTFDDGYADNLHAAAPLCARHRVPATVFVTSGMVGSPDEFWWDDVERCCAAIAAALPSGPCPVPGVRWAPDGAPLGAPAWHAALPAPHTALQRLFLDLTAALKPLGAAARAERVEALRAWAGVGAPARESHRTLTAAELGSLASAPGMSIGAHSVTHPVLATLAPVEQRRELADSRAALAQQVGRAVTSAAYPFGTADDIDAATPAAARSVGYRLAVANIPEAAWRWNDPHRLPRLLVRDWDGAEFSRQMTRWWRDG